MFGKSFTEKNRLTTHISPIVGENLFSFMIFSRGGRESIVKNKPAVPSVQKKKNKDLLLGKVSTTKFKEVEDNVGR